MTVIEELKQRGVPVIAITYSRFSSDNQREESIEAQQRAIRQFAEQNGVTIIRDYEDRAQSAKSDNREAFQRMIEDSRSKSFNIVLVHKLDRFSRNTADSAKYGFELRRNGVRLVSVIENFDDSPESRILYGVIEIMNQYYIENLSREVKKGMNENALKCNFTGGIPPWGYRLNKDTRKLEIDPIESEGVKLLFKRVLEGVGYGKIVGELNRLGYRTKRGNEFGKNGIYEILRNEKYTGVYIFNRCASEDIFTHKRNNHKDKNSEDIIRIEGGVPAIISRNDFDAVQLLLKSRKQQNAHGNAKETYLLTGKIFCGVCGSAYVGNRKCSGRNKNPHVTYRCNRRTAKTSIVCSNKEVRREYIEQFMLDRLADVIFDDKLVPMLAERYKEYMATYVNESTLKIKRLKKEINTLNKQMQNLVNSIAETGNALLVKSLEDKQTTLGKLEYDLKNEEMTLKTSELPIGILYSAMNTAREMFRHGELSETRQIITLYVKRVNVYPDNIEISLNVMPSMSYLTNIDSFMETIRTSSKEYATLSKAEIERSALNSEGKKNLSGTTNGAEGNPLRRLGSTRNVCTNGGGDGNWTRVQKPLDMTFFVDSLSFRIPLQKRRQTDSSLG